MPKPPEWFEKIMKLLIASLLAILGYFGNDIITKVSAHETRIAILETTLKDMSSDVHWMRNHLEKVR